MEQRAYRYSIPLSPDLYSLWRNRLAFLMPFHISRIGWLVCCCMFWMSFLCPRSHSGWIWPIGEFTRAGFTRKQAYRYFIPLTHDLHKELPKYFCMFRLIFSCSRCHSGWNGPIGQFTGPSCIYKYAYRYYSIPLSPDLHSIWRNWLAFVSPFCTSRIGNLCVACFDCVWYAPGPIPAELCLLVNLKLLSLHDNQITGTPTRFPQTRIPYDIVGFRLLAFLMPFRAKSNRMTWFLYILTEFCIPQVPSRLS